MYIIRNLEETLKKFLPYPEIIAVIGPRQAGKSTLIQNLLKNLEDVSMLSFEDAKILNLFEKSPDEFIAAYVKGKKYLFLDEFHYARHGGKILKYIYDSEKIKIIISGSSGLDITIHAAKFLVGRVLVFNLYPFDFQEFLRARDENILKLYEDYQRKLTWGNKPKLIKISSTAHRQLLEYFEEYSIFGGYPRVVLQGDYDGKKELLRNIYNTFFLREVRDILGLIDDYKLQNLIKALALQISNLIEYQELSRLSEFSFLTLKKYLSFLEKTYVCKLIKPYYVNKRTELVKNPKVFFLDTGLRNTVINDFRKFDERPDQGSLLENTLAMQFIKGGKEINFWRDKKQHEIDFIVALENRKLMAIESKSYLKSTKTLSSKHFTMKYPEIPLYFSYLNKIEGKSLKLSCPAFLF